MNNYSVTSVQYDSSSGSSNPLCTVRGSFNGMPLTLGSTVYFGELQNAFLASGNSGLQAILGPILLGAATGAPYTQGPINPNIAGSALTGIGTVTASQFACGSWSA